MLANRCGGMRRFFKSLTKCKAKDCDCIKLTLEHLEKGQEGIISSVPEHPLLSPLGLRPGKRIRMCTRECFGGPVIAEVERRSVALDRILARQIEITKGEVDAR